MLIDIIFFLISIAILVYSGSRVVKSLTKFSISLRISFFVISFILMALATTTPEFFVGISAAIKNQPIISLGNVLGSNIVNLSLILGISILLVGRIKIESRMIRNDFFHAAIIGFLPFALIIDGVLSRIDGVILLIIFIFYLYFLIQERKAFHKLLDLDKNHFLSGCVTNFFIFLISVTFLIFSAHFVVSYSVKIASDLQIPIILVSLFLIALGTSLPELVFSLIAVSQKEEMALGNLIGSTIINSSLILGVTALISPIQIINSAFLVKGIVAMGLIFLVLLFTINTKKELGKWAAILLLIIYVGFGILEFWQF